MSKDLWIETAGGVFLNLSHAFAVHVSYVEDPDASDVRAGNLTGRPVNAPQLEVKWSLGNGWVKYRLTGADADALEQRMLASDLQSEVADLHSIVRLLNERLAKLERG